MLRTQTEWIARVRGNLCSGTEIETRRAIAPESKSAVKPRVLDRRDHQIETVRDDRSTRFEKATASVMKQRDDVSLEAEAADLIADNDIHLLR